MKTREEIEIKHKTMVEICPDKIGLICSITSLEVLLDIREILQSLSEKVKKDES